MRTAIDNFGQPGFLPDAPDLIAPAGAWTDTRNVRFRDGSAEKCRGYGQALGDLSATAIWASPISDGTNYFWVYGSGTVMYATDGATHADITGPSLGAVEDLGYTGGPFHGHMIVNDGVNIPQSWSPSLGNNLISLTAWPSITCKVMRPYKDFLVALRISEGGDTNSRLIRWSDRAAQGALPLSWDFTDPTNQAGINELGQTADLLVDALPLRDSLIIYKENHTWSADYIGGDDVLSFRQVFSQIGMLTENCAVAFGSQHLVLTDQDIVLHDGNSSRSILDRRARRWLFSRINTTRFRRCFATADYRNREAYFCFPEAGYDYPNLSLVWNWADDSLHVYDLGGPKTWATPGIIPGSSVTFDADSGSFDDAPGAFDEETYNPFQSRVLLLDASRPRAYQNDTGETYDGTAMQVYAERTGMAITKDLGGIKRINRIYPRILGTQGDVLRIFIGSRSAQGGAVTQSGPYLFTIGVDHKIDLRVSARILDIRIEYSGTNTFRLHGLTFEHEADGYR